MAPVTKLYGTGGKRAAQMCRKSGGSVTAKKAVHKHEDHLHPGKPKTKLKAGGNVIGKAAAERPDRRARGGKIGSVVINIKGNGQGDAQADAMKQDMAAKAGLQKGVALGAQMAASKSPMPGPGPGGPPPGAMAPPGAGAPPPPMMPRARGGKIHMTASAAGGKGRLEKAAMAKASQPHRRGGTCS